MSYTVKPCFVYWLLDPWMEGAPPFYVGISINPWSRFYSHCHDRSSAAFPMLDLFRKYKVPRDKILMIFRECETRREALDLEYRLFHMMPGLVNRPYKKGKSY